MKPIDKALYYGMKKRLFKKYLNRRSFNGYRFSYDELKTEVQKLIEQFESGNLLVFAYGANRRVLDLEFEYCRMTDWNHKFTHGAMLRKIVLVLEDSYLEQFWACPSLPIDKIISFHRAWDKQYNAGSDWSFSKESHVICEMLDAGKNPFDELGRYTEETKIILKELKNNE